ncbi:Stp1/IreP family PP2C-type Ser/Thr phosphatase [Butyrivibrio sp. MC2013]|uniref:Stp1/IreP family PP2C-type Ser/Thr phosphatase n=1 Tax=Butyrivibrio sp. MC2013 TaxID=1280686 RepID=UPI00041E0E72|nr:Stp1/IreP family PP2C-type Ser/Thr phosphatase [Butyrivibrio sp. MC2013]
MIRSFSITDIGQVRKLNQDYVFSSEERLGNLSNVFIVADGMGGHKAGDYASCLAVKTVKSEIQKSFEQSPVKILDGAIQTANDKIREAAAMDENLRGMGTTMVACTVMGRFLQVANVGDSRLYIIDKDNIRQITRDHSLVEEMVRMGGIDRETARHHLDKNVITRAVGAAERVDVDFFQEEVHPGDYILMCSDGLTNMIEDDEIHKIVSSGKELEDIGKELVETANSNGGRDNIAVILIQIPG